MDDRLEPEAVLSLVLQIERLTAELKTEQTLCSAFARQVVDLQNQLATARADLAAARRERDELIQRPASSAASDTP